MARGDKNLIPNWQKMSVLEARQKKEAAAERKRERRERREAAARAAHGDTVVMSQAQLDRMVPR